MRKRRMTTSVLSVTITRKTQHTNTLFSGEKGIINQIQNINVRCFQRHFTPDSEIKTSWYKKKLDLIKTKNREQSVTRLLHQACRKCLTASEKLVLLTSSGLSTLFYLFLFLISANSRGKYRTASAAKCSSVFTSESLTASVCSLVPSRKCTVCF